MLELINATVIGEELAIAWGDGGESYLRLDYLRRACPCAACQGEPDAMGRVIRPNVTFGPQAFELKRIDVVGGYALQLFWGDNHSTGIYGFGYLRKLGEE